MIVKKVLTEDTSKITSISDKKDPNYTTAYVLKHKSYYLPKEQEEESTDVVLNNDMKNQNKNKQRNQFKWRAKWKTLWPA